ncbi:hypothetical protein K9B35_00320 [Sphingomonas sp. R647]|uniref:hypothetical protein n=1 Tax=Sphingomonas sp. R647 TaxID=2875233 RepID=UPI001CD6188B|nr:hypothetical protein [Sphingomonas sp. R647]MCA1196399.1 hypothetical protein [Sphingomonas sp. R647]
MDIKQLRASMDGALADAGLQETKLFPKRRKVWAFPNNEVIPFFEEAAYRRPWGFVYCGVIGIEIPALRKWLFKLKPGFEAGIFYNSFVGYHTANDEVLNRFMIDHGSDIPYDLWAGLIADRLLEIPETLDQLIAVYRSDRGRLGWLAHAHQCHAWNFMLAWSQDPEANHAVPTMQPNGEIA